MKQPLQVIHIEDSQADRELVETLLSNGGIPCAVTRIQTRDEFIEALRTTPVDLILSDCTLPQFHGLEALEIARATRPDIPFIFVSGTIGEETAIDSLRRGATDYVLKQGLSRLVPAVRRAMEEAETRNARIALESQLRQARKLETIGTLLGGIAHDFRNLLQILKLNLDLLPMVADDPKQVCHLAEQMNKTTDRGCDMMREILVFARKSDAQIEQVDVPSRLRETVDYLKIGMPANVAITLEAAADLPFLLADPSQIDRMIANLVHNARDAMPDGGEIAIAADLARFDRVHIQSWHTEETPYLCIRIADSGTGMDAATQARIFEPFFTTKGPGKGTGLGLPVVFGLVESHHGFIDVASQPGRGTIFSLFFPLPPGTVVPAERVEVVTPVRLLGRSNLEDTGPLSLSPAAEI